LSRKQADLIFSLVLLGIVTWMTWEATHWDKRAGLFPLSVGIPAVALCVLQLVFAIRGAILERRHAAMPVVVPATAAGAPEAGPVSSGGVMAEAIEQAFGAGSAAEAEEDIPPAVVRRRTIEMSAWIIGIALGILVFGFELGAALLSFAFLRWGAKEKVRISLVIAVFTYLFFYVVFDRSLNIPFPEGWLADAVGQTQPLDHFIVDPIANFIQNR
jgi:hypothetical protein